MRQESQSDRRARLRPWQRGLLMGVGVLCVALGTVGMFVPLLPTTPFLLLAAACFVRSSDRLYRWLTEHRLFGTYIRNYREHRAITLWTKVVTITLLWATILYGILAVVDHWAVQGLLGVIAVAVTVHLLSLQTATPELMARWRREDQPAGSSEEAQTPA